MRRLCNWLAVGVLGLALAGSPLAWAALCSQVFPQNATASGVALDLAGIMDGQTYANFPNSGAHYSTPGTWFYNNGTLGTWDNITVKAGATTWLFFDGDLILQPQSSINPYSVPLDSGGNPEDLIIIVRGNLTIGTKNSINALIYATGNVSMQPQSGVVGAITAQGTITMGSGTSVTYDPTAAATFNLPGACSDGSTPVVDHYQLSYASQALTCQPHTVTVTTCTDASCSTTYTDGPSSLTVTPGGSAISFTGSTTTPIAVRTPQTVALAVSGASPAPASATLCRIDGAAATSTCSLTFADAGLLVQAPDLIAGKADTLTVTAVRKSDNSAACVPAFASVSRPVQFWSTYLDPDAATQAGSRTVAVGGSAISASSASPTTLTLSFNASGQANASLNYADAGQVQVDARYLGSATYADTGLLMTGADPFVSRPYGLHLASDASCSAASVAGCTVLRAAGDSFPLRIRAVAWQADGEALSAAALADNPTTPNFRLSGIALSSSLVAPAGGDNGSLSVADYSHALGEQTTVNLSQSEVGIFTVTATPPATGYFGYTVGGGESALVGRFTPAYLGASVNAELEEACGAFSYQQQEIGFVGGLGPLLTVTGYNRQGAVTRNYDRGEFWRLTAPQRQDYLSISGRSSLDASGRLQTFGAAQSTALASDLAGDGARQFRWADDRLLWSAAVQPQVDDLAFGVAGAVIARLRLAAAQLTDADGICSAASGCSDFAHDFGGSEVRLGRLRFGNAFGSELQGLDVPFWLESWQATGGGLNDFRLESGDTCSAPLLGAPALQAVAGTVQPTDFTGPSLLAPIAGQGAVRLPAPGKEGSVSVGLGGLEGASPALPWLRYDWNGDGTREAARGLATFGIYRGSTPLIFRRELYR